MHGDLDLARPAWEPGARGGNGRPGAAALAFVAGAARPGRPAWQCNDARRGVAAG